MMIKTLVPQMKDTYSSFPTFTEHNEKIYAFYRQSAKSDIQCHGIEGKVKCFEIDKTLFLKMFENDNEADLYSFGKDYTVFKSENEIDAIVSRLAENTFSLCTRTFMKNQPVKTYISVSDTPHFKDRQVVKIKGAEYMGANDIALIGQDMSYEKNFHAGDTTQLLHAFHDQDVPDYTRGAQEIEDIFGEKRHTMGSLLSFKTSFESKIKTFNGTVINATEGALSIDGSKIMRLADFIDEHCDLKEIDTFSILSDLNNSEISYNLEGLLFQVTNARLMFLDIRKNAKTILKHIHRINKMKEKKQEKKPEFHNILGKIEDLTEKVKSPILNIIASYHYQLELYMMRQVIQDIDKYLDSVDEVFYDIASALKKGEIKKQLNGPVAHAGFKRLT